MNINKHYLIIIVVVFFSMIGVWYLSVVFDSKKTLEDVFYETETTTLYTTETESQTETESEKIEIKVYITGEVKNPGVYSANEKDRICDIVDKAGGLTEKADLKNINLAEYIVDEEHIIIPNIDDADKKDNLESLFEDNKGNSTKVNTYAITKIQSSIKNDIEYRKININTANAEELKTIKGIGDVLSQNIIDYREKNGPFKSIEEIKNVSRIGNKLFEKIKDFITVS